MDATEQTGFWELTAIMVVLASWVLYRYVAPKGWREWSRAGLVQAFIIALYAEMYGFPLTIYVLTGFLGIDIPQLHDSGHLVATLFGAGVLGQAVETVIGYGLLFLGVSLLIFPIIVWAYARLARKEEAQMLETFGDEYRAYRDRVPMFFPRRRE